MMAMRMISTEEFTYLNAAFTYHPPKPDQIPKYNEIRDAAREFAEMILGECPSSRERSLALTALENAVMWANAAISRNE